MEIRTRYFSGVRDGDSLFLLLDERFARCTFRCRFCTNSVRAVPGGGVDASPGMVAEVVAELSGLLQQAPTRWVHLASDDALAFRGILDLADLCRRREAVLEVITPGVRLRDARLVRGLAALGVRLQLTLLSTHDATYAHITGVPDARAQVLGALSAAREAGIPVVVGITITTDNIDELEALIVDAASRTTDHLVLRAFFPDNGAAPEAWRAQEIHPGRIFDALRAVADRGVVLPNLQLFDVPWCQVDEALVRELPIQVRHQISRHARFTWAPCETCPARARCSGMTAHALAAHNPTPPKEGQVASLMAYQEERWQQRMEGEHLTVVQDPLLARALYRAAALDGHNVTLGVEPAGFDTGCFFSSPTLGVYYRGAFDEPHLVDAFRLAVRAAVRDLRAGGESLAVEDVVVILERVRARMAQSVITAAGTPATASGFSSPSAP